MSNIESNTTTPTDPSVLAPADPAAAAVDADSEPTPTGKAAAPAVNVVTETALVAKPRFSMKRFLAKWWAYFHPLPGWKARYKMFKAGQHEWEIPGRPDASKTVPFPVDWIPHRLTGDDVKPETGFVFLEPESIETGLKLEIGHGVRCLRCGVPLMDNPDEANMYGGFDPPCCRRCRKIVSRVF